MTATRDQRGSAILVGIAVGVVVVLMIGGALFLSNLLKPGISSCSDMASNASSSAANGARRVKLIVGLAGNSTAAAAEARQFVASALAATTPDARAVVEIALVNGDREYQPAESAGACIGRDLLIAPSQADLDSYERASSEAKKDVEDALRTQYQDRVQRVAEAVERGVAQAPQPQSGDAGAFALWPFVAQAPADSEVFALGPFTVGGDNCLTVANPAEVTAAGSTLIDDRVRRCVQEKLVTMARAPKVRLTGATSLGLSGTERDAQAAVINALCRHATERGGCT